MQSVQQQEKDKPDNQNPSWTPRCGEQQINGWSNWSNSKVGLWVRISELAQTQSGVLKAQMIGVRPLHIYFITDMLQLTKQELTTNCFKQTAQIPKVCSQDNVLEP